MEVVNTFSGRAPTTGLMLAARVYNDTDDPWRDENGDVIRWREGVQVRRSACSGVHAHPVECVPDCCNAAVDPDVAPCNDPVPGFDLFRAFRLAKAMCVSEICTPGLLASMRSDFDALKGYALAAVLHRGIGSNPGLQTVAVDLSTGGPTSISEGIGTLMRNRGMAGIGGGWLHVPSYAAPSVASILADMTVAFGGAPFERVVMDYGYPVTGPTGTTVGPGEAWLYVSGPVVVGVSTNPVTDESRFSSGSSGCFKPVVDRSAVVAWQTCGTFAVKVDLRQKGC